MCTIQIRLDPAIGAALAAHARDKGIPTSTLAATLIRQAVSMGGDSAGFGKLHDRLSDHASAISRIDEKFREIDTKFAALTDEIQGAKRVGEASKQMITGIAHGLEKLGDKLGIPIIKVQSSAKPAAAQPAGAAPAAKSGA